MGIRVDGIIALMKERFDDFRGISAHALQHSLQVYRLFELREGEQLAISGSGDQDHLLVVLGRVQIDSLPERAIVLDSQGTAAHPFVLPPPPALTRVTAIDDSVLCHLDIDLLDILLAEEQVEKSAAKPETARLMGLLRNTALMRKIPLENLELVVESMREIRAAAGEELVTMGKDSGQFYMLIEGAAELWRLDEVEWIPHKTADLDAGTSFGEEDLLMSSASPVTVRITQDSRLLVLEKEIFLRLLAKPMVRKVDVHIANTMRERGYPLLDVRLEEEHEDLRIPDSRLIPLSQLRTRCQELDRDKDYIVYCRSGRRSSVASFILSEMGFSVFNMQGGINAWPFDVVGNDAE